MKAIKFIIGLTLSMGSFWAVAGTELKSPEPNSVYASIIKKATEKGLSNVKIDTKQSFDIINDGKNLGTLVQGKGWLRDVHPVCFVGWSTSDNSAAFFMKTMGVDDWETVDCDKVESVGVISKAGDKNTKIAIIYKVDARGQYSQDYVVLGLKNRDEVYFDKETTERFQNSYLKSIHDLRKRYQHI